MDEEQVSTAQLGNDPAGQFRQLLWAKIEQRFCPNEEFGEANLIDLSVNMGKAFNAEDVSSMHAPSARSLEDWFQNGRIPQRARFDSLLHVLFGAGWRHDEEALQLSSLRQRISNGKHPRNRSGRGSHPLRRIEPERGDWTWRQERIDLIGDGARRNSAPLAEVVLHIPDKMPDNIVPVTVSMTQDIDEIDIETDDGFETFLVSLAGSRLSIEFDDCVAVAGSRLGETDDPVAVPTSKGVKFAGGLWKLPGQSVHQRPLGDEPLFTLKFPHRRPCSFVLTLSCRNRQIKVCQEAKPDEEAISPLRERLIEAYIQKSLKQCDDGIVEVTKIEMVKA